LDAKTTSGRTYREALRANLHLIVNRAEPFARNPVYRNLIAFKDGEVTGDWRDSGSGHGATTDQEEKEFKAKGLASDRTATGGRYSFNINVALVPSALRIAAELFGQGESLDLLDAQNADLAAKELAVWSSKTRPLFQLRATAAQATASAQVFLDRLGLPPVAPLDHDFGYSALSLDRNGQPIPVIHTDEGFDLLFNEPLENVLLEIVDHLSRPFPYGLVMPVGMPVANAFLANDPKLQARFGVDEYHGFLVWGYVMAKWERGLAKQLKRSDLSAATVSKLRSAHQTLWSLLDQLKPHLKEELWSSQNQGGTLQYKPYKEANVLQYWNLSLLLLKNPYK
jgi:hypothetical protein